MTKEKILSCFIDESGDFGILNTKNPYYYVAMVFHDQDTDIEQNIKALDTQIINWNYALHAIHTGPLIRREGFYQHEERDNRRSLFNALYHFVRKLDIQYICSRMDKRELFSNDSVEMVDKLSKVIATDLRNQYDFISGFDKLIVYYDNGQTELTKIIASVFNAIFTNVEYRKVKPVDYKLLQAADLICTMELIADKAICNNFSNSEKEFFGKPREFIKNLYRQLEKKKL